jgi:hypothetical protein
VAAIVAIVILVSSDGDGDDDGSGVATSTPGPGETPSVETGTPGGGTPSAATPTAPSAATADDALTALISGPLGSTYVGPCPETPDGEIPQGLCSIELYRSAELVTFLIGQPFSEGVGEAVITPVAEGGPWVADFIPAPAVGGPEIVVGEDAMVFGAGDCLNFREEPSTTVGVVTCQLDGTRARVTDGPVDAGGQTWWQLEGLGWGSALYLVRPAP